MESMAARATALRVAIYLSSRQSAHQRRVTRRGETRLLTRGHKILKVLSVVGSEARAKRTRLDNATDDGAMPSAATSAAAARRRRRILEIPTDDKPSN
mmetsp:Transcript_10937/g.30706  ORF Transcript_10937/g.30706 Transcript_10937/m.30706 type:complete len:98 (+) Transcript_10937:1397-1690(+)